LEINCLRKRNDPELTHLGILVDDSLSDAMAKLTVKDGVPQYDPFVELTTFSNGATDTKKILLNVNLAGKHFDDDDFQGFLEFLDIKVTRLIEENPGKRVGILQVRLRELTKPTRSKSEILNLCHYFEVPWRR
jgi:benzoyl-CoA reductase/2-hydroxyglutaryl-CoA dehydratase subunit BcrC/BadD/HgdB